MCGWSILIWRAQAGQADQKLKKSRHASVHGARTVAAGTIRPPRRHFRVWRDRLRIVDGRKTIFRDTPSEILRSQIDRTAFRNPRDLNEEIPAALEKVILTCLEREPDKRYPIMSVLVHELETILYV